MRLSILYRARLSHPTRINSTITRAASSGRERFVYNDNFGYIDSHPFEKTRSTTILCIRKDNKVVMIGDGQVSRGATIVKGNATKVRRIRKEILVGMAGAAGDCLTLIERLERSLDETAGNLTRACVALAKAWRTEKYLKNLDAVLCVADKDVSLVVAGNGDVIQPEDGIMSVGSGGTYALAAAKGLIDIDGLDAEHIARKSMKIAADICVYTNHNFLVETLDVPEATSSEKQLEPEQLTNGDNKSEVVEGGN